MAGEMIRRRPDRNKEYRAGVEPATHRQPEQTPKGKPPLTALYQLSYLHKKDRGA